MLYLAEDLLVLTPRVSFAIFVGFDRMTLNGSVPFQGTTPDLPL